MKPRALLLVCAVGAIALSPAAAAANTKPVLMGLPGKYQKQFGETYNADVNAFFPSRIKIHKGDAVAFTPQGFHNVDLPAKGGSPLDFLLPGDPVSGAKDAAGADFWFNGQRSFGLNPEIFDPVGAWGKSFTYTGTKRIQSGAPLGEGLKPVKVTFPRTGNFTYFCDIHAGMKGTVSVVARSAAAPSKRSDARAVKRQVNRAIEEAKGTLTFKPGSGIIQFGASGRGGVESYGTFPEATSVKVGTTVTFKMPARSRDNHTATTGPGDPNAENSSSYLRDLAASFEGTEPSPIGVFSSEQPGGTPATLTTTLHGNGFWNSGVLDAVAASPLPARNQVTFAEPGKFAFYCLIHPFMKSTVTVTP